MFPQMIRIQQTFGAPYIPDVSKLTIAKLSKFANSFHIESLEGKRIGITVGSRGISNIIFVLKSISLFIKSIGGIPYLIPAMGTHGGGCIDGQLGILKSLGITEESI